MLHILIAGIRSLDVHREDGPFSYHANQLWLCKTNKFVS